MSPSIPGLKRCFPRTRTRYLAPMPMAAASGGTQNASVRRRSDRPSPVMSGERNPLEGSRRSRSQAHCTAQVEARSTGGIQGSTCSPRKATPSARKLARKAICSRRGSRGSRRWSERIVRVERQAPEKDLESLPVPGPGGTFPHHAHARLRRDPARGPGLHVGGADPVGAVRELRSGTHPALIIYIENSGDIAIPVPAIRAVHDGKVVLDADKLEDPIRRALGHVRDSEVPGW